MLYKRFLSLGAYLGVLCFLSIPILRAQEMMAKKPAFDRSLELGLQFGGHASRYNFNPKVSQGLSIGKLGGLRFRYNVERGASLQIELNYLQTGWAERFDEAGLAYQRQFTYVELPFLTHLYLGKGIVRPFVNAGPYIALNLSEEGVITGEKERFTERQLERQALPLKNRIAWGLMGGAGLSFRLGARHRLELEGRIVYSYTDVWGNKRTDPYGQSSEMRFGLLLGYLFRF